MPTNKSRIYDQQGLSRSSAWNKEKKAKGNKKIFRFLLLIFLGFVILTLVVQLPPLINKLRKPFATVQSEFASLGEINLQHRTNILIVTFFQNSLREMGFVSLEKGDHKVKLIKLNPKLKFSSSKGLVDGKDFLITKDKKVSIDKLEAGLVASLGYIFDGYMIVSDEGLNLIEPTKAEDLIEFFYSPSFFWGLKANKDYLDKNLKSNLTLDQIVSLTWYSKNLTPDRVKFIDLSASLESDGQINYDLAINKIGLLLTDNAIAAQAETVEIQNASSVAGVGNILKRVIANLGSNVLEVTKVEKSHKTSILVKNKSSKLAKRLETILGVKMEQINRQETSADLKVIIGENYSKYFDF